MSDDAGNPSTVVKLGGSLARDPALLRRVVAALGEADDPPVVVPGGGALADAVRAVHARGGMREEVAHRMALLALDQMALWIADLADGRRKARVVRSAQEVSATREEARLSVVAPFEWLERDDPLPASWTVTSDAIAAWIAGRIGATRLLLLKSFAFRTANVSKRELRDEVDGQFLTALPAATECVFVDGRDPDGVAAVLAGSGGGTRLLR